MFIIFKNKSLQLFYLRVASHTEAMHRLVNYISIRRKLRGPFLHDPAVIYGPDLRKIMKKRGILHLSVLRRPYQLVILICKTNVSGFFYSNYHHVTGRKALAVALAVTDVHQVLRTYLMQFSSFLIILIARNTFAASNLCRNDPHLLLAAPRLPCPHQSLSMPWHH